MQSSAPMLEARACLVGPALAVIAACAEPGLPEEPGPVGSCPPDEVCSPRTPLGIHLSSPRMFDDAPGIGVLRPVVRGGTQLISVSYEVPGGERVPMDHPYVVDAGAEITVETVFSSSLAVRGAEVGAALVRLVDERDGKLYGREVVETAALDRIELSVATPTGAPPGRPIAFSVGAQWFGVRLLSAASGGRPPLRLVDESMRLELAGGTQGAWDALGAVVTAPGVQMLAVHVGGGVRMIELPFVEQADAIEISHEAPEYFGNVGMTDVKCFYATAGGRVIAGVTWSFALDSGTAENLGDSGCVEYKPATTGTRRLTVTALGASREVPITVPF